MVSSERGVDFALNAEIWLFVFVYVCLFQLMLTKL